MTVTVFPRKDLLCPRPKQNGYECSHGGLGACARERCEDLKSEYSCE